MSVELAEQRGHVVRWPAQRVAALAALVVLIWALFSPQAFWPRWPLWLSAVLLALGLVADQLAVSTVWGRSPRARAMRRCAQPAAAVAALLVAVWDLSHAFPYWPTWPLWVAGGLLCSGLAAAPLGQLAEGWAARRFAPIAATAAVPVAAAAALFVLILGLSVAFYPAWPIGALRAAAVLLGLGFVAARLTNDEAVRGLVYAATALAALFFLINGLTDTVAVRPMWPLWTFATLLSAGLMAAPAARLADGRDMRRSAQSLAAVMTLLVLVAGLSCEQFVTLPMGSLRTVAVLLGVGLLVDQAADQLADGVAGAETVRRFAQPVAAILAVFLLAERLSDTPYLAPAWPLWAMAALLALGLVAGPLARVISRPADKVLSERVDQLSRTRRGALDVQATELRRIERDLHDGAQVRLVALSMKLGRAEDRYRDDPETAALLREAREDAAAAIRELRELARGIAPPVLTDRGLEAAVRSLAQRSGADVTVIGELPRRPLPAVETAAYFVVAESLTNAAKHAPGSRVEVRIDERGGDLFLEITDFGPGGADPAGGGLTGLLQRVEALDGTLHVTSPAGVGTQVEAVLPCGR
ncbi:MAG TPA: histidine kinase [Solirubrobacteraceae bacterium]|nr:histidine kinase [Solirubrobacteraceae bacterium]